jgi:phospholipid transport system transporter-binding protein
MIRREGDRLIVEGRATHDSVPALLAEGRPHLVSGVSTVDLAGLTEADSSALALMLEWTRVAGREGGRVRFCNVPSGLRSLAELYGVAGLLARGD